MRKFSLSRMLALLSLAILLAASGMPLVENLSVRAQELDYTYSIEQGGDSEIEVSPLVGGTSVQAFYDYRDAEAHTGLEESDTSILFLYEDPDGILSLVIVHDKPDQTGGKAIFEFGGVPDGSSFVVQDDVGDDLGFPRSEWIWLAAKTDGAAVSGSLENQEWTITIDSAFLEWDSGEKILYWKFLSGDLSAPTEVQLAMGERLTIKSRQAVEAATADLGISASDLVFSPENPYPNESVTINAKVTNLGSTDISGVTVRFSDFGDLLGQQTIATLPVGATVEVSVETKYNEAGAHFVSVTVDPDNMIPESNEGNNEASRLLQVGDPDPSSASMVVHANSASTCPGNSVTLTGQAFYDFAQVEGTDDYPVQGGQVTISVVNLETGAEYVYTGAHTDVHGNFEQTVIAPTADGTYPVRIQVTDKTLTQLTETKLTVSGECSVPPTVPLPPPSGGGDGGGDDDSVTLPPPNYPAGTTPIEVRDLYVRSQDIYFSDENPDPGETITLFAYVHYYGDEPVDQVPVTFNDIFPVGGVLKTVPIGTTEVSFPNGTGSAMVILPWTGNAEGAHIIQLVVTPPFDQFTKNDKATRLIVTGDLPRMKLLKEVELLDDADGSDSPSPGDTLQYTIAYENLGAASASGVVLNDYYDESLMGVPIQISGDGSAADGILTWMLGDLAAGASGSVSYQVDIPPTSEFPAGRTTIANIAVLSADQTPPVAAETTLEVVVNLPPTVDAGPDQTVEEGNNVVLAATGSDPDGELLTYTWDLDNDGVFETDGQNVTYAADDGPASHTVRVQATDPGGLTATDSAVITVENVAPTASFEAPASVNEGSDFVLALTSPLDPSDADVSAGFTYAFDCGDGSGYSDWSSDNTTTCLNDDNGSRTANGIIRDKDGGQTEYTTAVEVENVAPTADFAVAPATLSEGQDAVLSFSNPFDPSAADVAAGFGYAFGCEADSALEATDADVTYTCHYADNDTITARGRIQDKDGGFTDYSASVVIDNVAPSVGPITAPLEPVAIGAEVSASADFVDPGVLDTHTAVWEWGDGTSSDGAVEETEGSWTVIGSHTYTETAGVYTIRLTVTDKDGDTGSSILEYLVVYDPEGGFVTGGGWIDSPPGACNFDSCTEDTTGKANFGFVSKYLKGAKVPTGNTEFQFKAGDLNFHSSSYQWLVIAGAKAQFKGDGTINGEGNYGFMLTAVDAKLTPSTDVDKFRIKIWDKDTDTVVYDNQMEDEEDAELTTTIGGGSIVIQK